MASLVLGVAGAWLGGLIGGPVGASIGWSVGAALGNALEPKKGVQGPRLDDLKLHTSSYGATLPVLYGTVRAAGNVIWQTDLVEHENKSGGKGGPTVSNFTYTCSFAVALCEGPIVGITRIWGDNRLIWSGGGTDPNLTPLPMTIYLGTEAQDVDPTIEADVGAGNAPAHRGIAYVVFTDLDMTPYYNRIPNLTFEIIASNQGKLQRINTWPALAPIASYPLSGVAGVRYDGSSIFLSTYGGYDGSPSTFGPPNTYKEDQYDFAGNLVAATIPQFTINDPSSGYSTVWYQTRNGNSAMLRAAHPDGTVTWSWYVAGTLAAYDVTDKNGLKNSIVASGGSYGNGYLYTVGGGGAAYILRWDAPAGVPTGAVGAMFSFDDGPPTYRASPDYGYDVTVADDGTVWAMGTNSGGYGGSTRSPMWHLDKDLNVLASWPRGDLRVPPNVIPGGASWVVWSNFALFYRSVEGFALYSINADLTFTLLDTYSITNYWPVALGGGYFLDRSGVFKIGTPPTLASIVSDISVRAGLTTADLNVTQLTDLVLGYSIGTQQPARSAIEPLQSGFFFDAVESDALAKFVKRGAQPVASIPVDDLGAYSTGNAPPLTVTSRAQESDLPRTVYTNYINIDSDYQTNTQIARRLATGSKLDVTLTLPIVMTDLKAKSVADTSMMAAWREREALTWYTPRIWAKLEPCDVVTVNGYDVRIVDRSETIDGVIKWDGVPTLSQVYNTTQPKGVAGSGLPLPPQVPPMTMTTDLVVMDLSLVADTDSANGYYAAACGSVAGIWKGCALFKSVDGGSSYTQIMTDSVADAIGASTTVLPNFGGGLIFDEASTVTVVLRPGAATLAGMSAANVLAGANAASLGDEIIGFKIATLIGTRTYRLSGLLRGRRGTEWAMDRHGVSERFVTLPPGMNVPGPLAEIGGGVKFRAVTIGGYLATANTVDFTNAGAALRCYAPVQLGGGRNAANDVIVNWVRRTRIGGDLLATFADVPLSETTEAYQVNVYANGLYLLPVKRAIAVAGSPTTTYTAAQQTTDFGAVQSAVYFDVAQLGVLGYGTPARGIA